MKRTVTNDPKNEVLDRLLDEHLAGSSEQLAPSSGFAASVMESIQTEAVVPPPIAFPWRRALPGAVAALSGLIILIVLVLRGGTASAGAAAGPAAPAHAQLAHFFPAFSAGETVLCWILVAACISVAAIAASFRLTGRNQ